MIFGYKCPVCKQSYVSKERADRLDRICVGCGHTPLHRDYSGISLQRPMQEHYNASVNAVVSSPRGFYDALKRREQEASEYDGLDHDFQPIDISDPAAVGVNGVGLDATQDARRREGLKPIDLDRYFG